MDHHSANPIPWLVTSVAGASGSILNNVIGIVPDIVSVLAGIAAIAAGTLSALLSWEKREEIRRNRGG